MKIGNIDLGNRPVMLAPMEDVTDQSFRQICREQGADMVYTEFVSADAVVRNIDSTLRKMVIAPGERPAAIQIYGRFVDAMVEAATREVVKAVHLPVTVKTRLGWDHDSKIIVDLAEQLQDCGIAALTIHGRTRSQLYNGEADWTLIGQVKNNPRMHIPIIGNGDINSPQKLALYYDRYGVDGVMVGRASIGAPWIFREMKQYLATGEVPVVTDAEKMALIRRQIAESIESIDEYRGILHIRRHLAATPLFKGIRDFRPMRIAMLQASTRADLEKILDKIETDILPNR